MRFFNETRQITGFCRLFHGESQGCTGERTLLFVRSRRKSRNRKISADDRRLLKNMGPSPDRFSAGVGSTCHSPTCSHRQKKGEVVRRCLQPASRASINPYYHPSQTGIEHWAGERRALSTSVKIMVNTGMLLVTPPVRFLTVECPCTCKATRKVYR